MKIIIFLLTATYALAQGPLTPPGAPAPTMKTLAQIEARTPIPATPGFTFGGPFFTITAPGSYYLTGNVSVTTGNGIAIEADDVMLDLNGFNITTGHTGGASGSAIVIDGSHARITIKNGSVKSGTIFVATPVGFQNGIFVSTGNLTQARVSDVHITGVGGHGIVLSDGIVERCTVHNCGATGITASIVNDSIATNCRSHAITALKSAQNSSGTSFTGFGLDSGENALNCTGISDSGTGLRTLSNATNCTGRSTSSIGMFCRGNATNCIGSSSSGTAGIEVTGTASFCRGSRGGGVAIRAAIAIGCTVEAGGTVVAPQKHLGTP